MTMYSFGPPFRDFFLVCRHVFGKVGCATGVKKGAESTLDTTFECTA